MRREQRRSASVAFFATMFASAACVVGLGTPWAFAASEQVGTIVVDGQLTRPADPWDRPMAVDEGRNLGFVTNFETRTLDLVDLERLTVVGKAPFFTDTARGNTPDRTLALDTRRERLYKVGAYPAAGADVVCTASNNTKAIGVFDYSVRPDGQRRLTQDFVNSMPCTGPSHFLGLTNSYYVSPDDSAEDRLYVGGVPGTDGWRSAFQISPLPILLGGSLQEDRGQPLLVRQLAIRGDGLCNFVTGRGCTNPNPSTIGTPVLDWEVDLRVAGCGRRERVGVGLFDGFVVRHGDNLLVYCWDGRAHQSLSVGAQGYLVRIPLTRWADGVMRPVTRGAPTFEPTTGQITNYVYRRVPTLAGSVTPILDPVSGRIMLVTADETNGNAVWVFDPSAERFVGVITGGYGDQPPGNTAVGFDSERGRVYLLTQAGILIAPVRVDPLPAGLIYPVLANEERREDFVTSDRISVAPRLGRLFVALNDYNDTTSEVADHYEVLRDHVPDPPGLVPIDPDSLTSQVEEAEGRTAHSATGQAIASGVHVINTGGAARLVGQNDPSCDLAPPNFDNLGNEEQKPVPDWEVAPALVGACVSELVVSPGHREFAGASTELETGTGAGATARGSAFAFGSNDAGFDGDVRRMTDCAASTPEQADRWGRRWPFPDHATTWAFGGADAGVLARRGSTPGAPPSPAADKEPHEKRYNDARDAFWDGFFGSEQFTEGRDQYSGGCNQLQDGVAGGSAQTPTGPVDLRSGTKGADGRGFPVRAAVCGDFGGSPSSETWPEEAAGQPQVGYPTSSASCDASVPGAQSLSSAGALAFPSPADAQLSVARVSSKVTSVRTPEGQVTMAFASASGVQVGPLSIGEIRSLAITKAAGRKGTTSAVLVRQWCGLSVAGQEQQGCVDATSPQVKDLLDEVSSALLQKVQLSVPQGQTQATPGGYQAVVTKHPGQRGADQTVNDDDSHTVSALQVILYNDGPRGRSRLIVQLAGVHAESRYGIIELPNFSTGPGGTHTPPPAQPGPDPAPTTDPGPTSDPGPAAGPLPPTFTPESFVDEVFTEEVVRTNSAPPAPRFLDVPDAGSPAERIVRVPIKALSDAINLFVQHPREFALLFLLFSLLATPLYLGSRRRSFARALLSP